MDLCQDSEFNKSYSKYKMIVKKWEKGFFKCNGRIPSRYDIKEADETVRRAYKQYFNLKSAVLETSLMDVPIDGDDEEDEEDDEELRELNAESVKDDSEYSLIPLPSANQIREMISKNEESEVVENLDRTKNSDKKFQLSKSKSSLKISNDFFKSCSFNKRNPRKSFTANRSMSRFDTSLISEDKSLLDGGLTVNKNIMNNSTHENKLLVNRGDSALDTMEKIPNDEFTSKVSSENGFKEHMKIDKTDFNISAADENRKNISLNIITQHNIKINSYQNTRKIDIGWLNRCDDTLLSNQTSLNLTQSSEIPCFDKVENQNFGMRNLRVAPIISEIHPHDTVIENSESETENNTNKSFKFKKIKPVVKKIKLQTKNENSAESDEPKLTKTLRSKRKQPVKVKSVIDSDSESECDLTRRKRINLKAKSDVNKKDVKSSDDQEILDETAYTYDSADINMPRYAIKDIILETNNLTDGLSAAIEIPRGNIKKITTSKYCDEKEKLEKKIETGQLNENFVKINLEKKVYARGKKTMSFSKHKKQLWKNKKKMLHNTPEFPEGGILKCFKCNEAGHLARYCTAHKSNNNLLPLGENLDDTSHQTLKEAESKIFLKPKISEIFQFEKISSSESNSENITQKGVQPITQTFLRLLETKFSNSSSIQKEFIKPLYSLKSDGKMINTPSEVNDALKLFGHTSFRSGQEIAIMRILSGMSTLVTLSTGSGKSLCYQLPAYLYAQHNHCITIVISPLVSLMEDQVVNMPGFLHAACLHTNQTVIQREKITNLIKDGKIHILLISPEAIVSGEKSTGFGSILKELPPIAFACIDEVHCVSQWSHNFRPSYLMVCRVLQEKLGVKCILGLTATATKPAITNIIQHLNIPDSIEGVVTNLPLPDNLILTVSEDTQRDIKLLEMLESERFNNCNSIIIYCIRRDECERIAGLIRSSTNAVPKQVNSSRKRKRLSWFIEAYHAGMSATKRKQVQQGFMSGEIKIVVATVAFGMGINKSDIRGVIHYNMPSSFESYVQEIGRAGRDGKIAHCHVFIDHEFKDKHELLRHIHTNSIERHTIRKLLQKVFIPCCCATTLNDSSVNNDLQKCPGHEVAFPIDETVTELDIPSENIFTLLCYLELHQEKYIKVLSNAYIMCKMISYAGCQAFIEAAEKSPPLAMAIALLKKKKEFIENTNVIEFSVIDVASAMGWESGVTKYHLKNLEWIKINGLSKKSPIRVEFHTLGFRIRSPGDLKSEQLDVALDALYERAQLQEKAMLQQLEEVSQSLKCVSYKNISECSALDNIDTYKESSNKLRIVIRSYFARESLIRNDLLFEKRPIRNKDQVICDVRALLSCYKDCTFTGRAIARIFQGISSPNFPALVWGRCRFWRSYLSVDFYELVDIAKQQILQCK